MHISVVVLTFFEPYFVTAVDAVNEQSRPADNKVLLVDSDFAERFQSLEGEVTALLEGWTVVFHDVSGDLARHRNYVKPLLPEQSWIFMLDDDEFVPPDMLATLEHLLERGPADQRVYSLPRVNTYGELGELPDINWLNPDGFRYPDYQPRVFLNSPDVGYSGLVHSRFTVAMPTVPLVAPAVTLRHHKTWEMQHRSDKLWAEMDRPAAPTSSDPKTSIGAIMSEASDDAEELLADEGAGLERALLGRDQRLRSEHVDMVEGEESAVCITAHQQLEALEWIRKLGEGATGYLEFGAGGSTLEALSTGIPIVVSVESDRKWVDEIRAAAGSHSLPGQKFTCLHADIGPTREWGNPVRDVTVPMSRAYVVDPFTGIGELDRDKISHVLIDGRWRVGTAIASVLLLPNIRELLVDDYRDRIHYHTISSVLGIDPLYFGRAALFRVEKKAHDPARLLGALVDYLQDCG